MTHHWPCALVLLLALGCQGPELGRNPELLTVLAESVEVAGLQIPEIPAQLLRPAEDLVSELPAAPTAIQRVRVGAGFHRDERLALLAPHASTYRFRFRVPPRSRLRTAVAAVLPQTGLGALHFRIRLHESDGSEVTLAERTLEPDLPAGWGEVSIDLAPWASRTVDLEFQTTAAAGATTPPLLGAWELPRIGSVPKRQDPRPNIVWISVDTLRADHLGCYGHTRPTSPALDAMAERGIRFSAAISQAPWTRPSHRSMLTGLYPAARAGLRSPLIGVPLQKAGYRTTALVGIGQVDSRFGFDRGFEIYRTDDWIRDPVKMVGWVEERLRSPYFLFLHTYEPHEPYTHTEFAEGLPSGRLSGKYSKNLHYRLKKLLSDDEKRYVEALYDGDVAYTDARLGELFAELDRRGNLESTILIVTSDHGEQFWDHGSWGHGQNLYDHQIRVPLILHLPSSLGVKQGRVIEEQVELLDLYPTLLDLVGVPLTHEVQGRTLRPLLEGGSLPPRQAFAENTNIKFAERKGLRTERYKFILAQLGRSKRGEEGYELYDLRADPGERKNLAALHPERVASFRQQVMRRVRPGDAELDVEVPPGTDAELRKELEALGYLGN